MSLDIYLAYLLAVVLLTASPGPMVLLTMKHGVERGLKGTLVSALTGMVSICVMIVFCFYGVSQLLQSNDLLKNTLIISGIIYIIYLGLQSIIHSKSGMAFDLNDSNKNAKRHKTIIKEMVIVAWTNPKDWIFFGLFLPQFIDLSSPLLPQLLIMLATFSFCELFFLTLYGVFSFYFSVFFNKYVPAYKIFLGFMLIILGILM
nr:LysE family transporter [Cellvibrionaceae bacterium]